MTTPTTPAQARALDGYFLSMDERGAVINSLADQVEALTADLAAEKLFSKQAMESVTEIAAQRDALKPGAERYQWLRNLTRGHRGACFDQMWFLLPDVKRIPGQNIMQGSVAQHLDAAIDAAMKAES